MRARAFLACLLAAGCGATQPDDWQPSFAAPYSALDEGGRELMRDARAHLEAGESLAAWRILHPLARQVPDNIDLGVVLQEVELELFAAGGELDPVLAPFAGAGSPEESLRLRYAGRSELSPSPAGYVLAARAETDLPAAQDLLERALELDPACAWAHYGRAHVLLKRHTRYRWREAHAALERALELEPEHLQARRLEAWMLAQEGSVPAAAAALGQWLEVTAGDPRVTAATRTEALVDLAHLWLLDERSGDAIVLLHSLDGDPVARARRLTVLAGSQLEEDELVLALDAARRARAADPDELLPLVQQALLYQHWLDDPVAAEAKWREVIEAAQGQSDLRSLMQALRARVALERSGAAVPEAPR